MVSLATSLQPGYVPLAGTVQVDIVLQVFLFDVRVSLGSTKHIL